MGTRVISIPPCVVAARAEARRSRSLASAIAQACEPSPMGRRRLLRPAEPTARQSGGRPFSCADRAASARALTQGKTMMAAPSWRRIHPIGSRIHGCNQLEPFRRLRAKPDKKFVDIRLRSLVHGRRPAWRVADRGSGDRWVAGSVLRGVGAISWAAARSWFDGFVAKHEQGVVIALQTGRERLVVDGSNRSDGRSVCRGAYAFRS